MSNKKIKCSNNSLNCKKCETTPTSKNPLKVHNVKNHMKLQCNICSSECNKQLLIELNKKEIKSNESADKLNMNNRRELYKIKTSKWIIKSNNNSSTSEIKCQKCSLEINHYCKADLIKNNFKATKINETVGSNNQPLIAEVKVSLNK